MSTFFVGFKRAAIFVAIFLHVISNVELRKRNGLYNRFRFQNSLHRNQPFINRFTQIEQHEHVRTTPLPQLPAQYWYPFTRTDVQFNAAKRKMSSHSQSTTNGNEDGIGNRRQYKNEEKIVERDDTIDGLTGVIGPLIFPIPFLFALLPFAIPAIPIALSLPFGNSSEDVDARVGAINNVTPTVVLEVEDATLRQEEVLQIGT